MTKKELLMAYACAGSLWSSFKMPSTDFELKLFDNVWFSILQPYDIGIVLQAMKEYARKNDFCNIAKVGDLCETMTEIANGTFIDEESVLSEIRRAISYDKCRENFNNLSPFAKEVVEGSWMLARWSQSSELDSVIMSGLRKKIHNMLEQKRLLKAMQSEGFVRIEDKKRLEVKNEIL